MRIARARRGREEGFTLIELLVVMLLLTVIGSIATAAVNSAFGGTRRTQARIYAVTDLERATERITRELRAAHPIEQSMTTTIPALEIAQPNRIIANVVRDGGRIRFTYELQGGALRETRQTYATIQSTTPSSTVTDSAQAPFLPQVSNATAGVPVFTYFDRFGDPTTEAASVARVAVTFVRDLPEQDAITVETQANLRNSRE